MRRTVEDAGRELALQLRLFWRDGSTVALTLIFPAVSLAFVQALSAGTTVPAPGYRITTGLQLLHVRDNPDAWVRFPAYGTAGIIVLGLAVACFAHVGIEIAQAREHGILRRVRTTPLALPEYLAGKIGASIVVGIGLAALLLTASALRYDVQVAPRSVPILLLLVVLGALVYAGLGVAASSLSWNAQTAHALAYSLLIPLVLASALFHPPQLAPAVVRAVGEWLPFQPLVSAIFGALGPDGRPPSVAPTDVAKLALWGIAGLVAAATTFRWAPAHED